MIKLETSLNPRLVNQEEAEQLLRSVSNAAVRQLVEIAYIEVKRRFEELESLPGADFDVLFFMEALKVAFSNIDDVRRILDGEDLASQYDW